MPLHWTSWFITHWDDVVGGSLGRLCRIGSVALDKSRNPRILHSCPLDGIWQWDCFLVWSPRLDPPSWQCVRLANVFHCLQDGDVTRSTLGDNCHAILGHRWICKHFNSSLKPKRFVWLSNTIEKRCWNCWTSLEQRLHTWSSPWSWSCRASFGFWYLFSPLCDLSPLPILHYLAYHFLLLSLHLKLFFWGGGRISSSTL